MSEITSQLVNKALSFNTMSDSTTVLGIMSGTSLDGVDIAICNFMYENYKWNYKVIFTKTYPYNYEWKKKLSDVFKAAATELTQLDREYGFFLGELAADAIKKSGTKPELIASHGHTVHHNPKEKYTVQIGHGACIAAVTGITTVSDFRSADVARGGEGAPLVPAGDKLLFSKYDACLNLGGIANISLDHKEQRIAGDICPVNTVLNYYAEMAGKDYDPDGSLGKTGKLSENIFNKLNNLDFYSVNFPKSIGREWVETNFLDILEKSNDSIQDKLNTIYHHIVFQTGLIIKKYRVRSILLSGGGTYNLFLLQLLQENISCEWIIPDSILIEFKEAIIFGFLGLLRIRGQVNCYSSVTGAHHDCICGAVYK
ncbi:MAG: anhydro-N-acetylmuramic acid kinase [Bacteroidales bacterium]|nr:anhydro-N-acetylmuramic acid kinase [Bacteroidales bacterium]